MLYLFLGMKQPSRVWLWAPSCPSLIYGIKKPRAFVTAEHSFQIMLCSSHHALLLLKMFDILIFPVTVYFRLMEPSVIAFTVARQHWAAVALFEQQSHPTCFINTWHQVTHMMI